MPLLDVGDGLQITGSLVLQQRIVLAELLVLTSQLLELDCLSSQLVFLLLHVFAEV